MNNNPLSFIDADGLNPVLVAKLVVRAVVAGSTAYGAYKAGKSGNKLLKNASESIDKMDALRPPSDSSSLEINPATNQPWALDQAIQSRENFDQTAGDIIEFGRDATELISPGPEDVLKKVLECK